MLETPTEFTETVENMDETENQVTENTELQGDKRERSHIVPTKVQTDAEGKDSEKRRTAETTVQTTERITERRTAGTTQKTERNSPKTTASVQSEKRTTVTTSREKTTTATTEERGTAETTKVHVHSYTGKQTKAPTCTSTGTMTYSCFCGASYTESIPKTEHTWTAQTAEEYVIDQAAWTEKVYGPTYNVYVCNSCGYEASSESELFAHQDASGCSGYYVDFRNDVSYVDHPKTGHYEEVITGYRCSVCGAEK